MKQASDLRQMNEKELNSELRALLQELFNLRIQKAAAPMAATHPFKRIRKDIARIKTVLNERKKAN